MKTQMQAELLFDHPNDRDLAVAELAKLGFEVENLDWVDEHEGVVLSETAWVRVQAPTRVTITSFLTRWRISPSSSAATWSKPASPIRRKLPDRG